MITGNAEQRSQQLPGLEDIADAIPALGVRRTSAAVLLLQLGSLPCSLELLDLQVVLLKLQDAEQEGEWASKIRNGF